MLEMHGGNNSAPYGPRAECVSYSEVVLLLFACLCLCGVNFRKIHGAPEEAEVQRKYGTDVCP